VAHPTVPSTEVVGGVLRLGRGCEHQGYPWMPSSPSSRRTRDLTSRPTAPSSWHCSSAPPTGRLTPGDRNGGEMKSLAVWRTLGRFPSQPTSAPHGPAGRRRPGCHWLGRQRRRAIPARQKRSIIGLMAWGPYTWDATTPASSMSRRPRCTRTACGRESGPSIPDRTVVTRSCFISD